ncbi:SDR family NAD(P)-dependent oxidoreductase [Streptomyces cyslabdanicus]|uniref:SDR family NAD(P)-dependent oxidoreductase n=1 Tax=Streptomyces cyslabdanicus TaxID=1470456 RepID=UPI0040450139
MSAPFHGKVALVTGAGSGIGRTSARAFAARGATVVVADLDAGNAAQTVKLIERGGGRASAVTVDVTDSASVQSMVDTAVSRHGGLHIAHNNAGVFTGLGPLADLDEGQWHAQLAVNLTGVMLAMKYEIRHMRDNGGGVIVNAASNIGDHVRYPGTGAYAASKAAVSTLTRAAALDHIKDGIRINAVSPGASNTSMTFMPGESEAERAARLNGTIPLGRLAETDEIVASVLWLASEESSFVVGHDLVTDGGASA